MSPIDGRPLVTGFAGILFIALLVACQVETGESRFTTMEMESNRQTMSDSDLITLVLGGDVMTGRGIDQVLPHPGDPTLHEPYMTSALGYVELAEAVNGHFQWPVECDYIWGDALDEMEGLSPEVRIIILETGITTSDEYWRGKGIHYRMHP